jgi:hypothetical protein
MEFFAIHLWFESSFQNRTDQQDAMRASETAKRRVS